MEKDIKQLILLSGADVCGIASIDRFASAPAGFSPADVYHGCKSVIVFGKALPKGMAQVESRIIYGHYNSFICGEVDGIALQAARLLEERFGAVAVPLPCDSPYEYWDSETQTGKGLISMKHAAVLCGLGQLGKNTLLLNPDYGNLLTIGAVLTDLELQSDGPCKNICLETCTRCVDSCPAHAMETERVNQLLCRKKAYGKTKRGFETVECNLCRTVCPMRYGIK